MKYFYLVWAGLWRKPIRTVLTALCVTVAFVLIGILQGINHGMDEFVSKLHLDRLYVMNRTSMLGQLPLASMGPIEKINGVRRIAYWAYFAGYYQDTRNQITVVAADVPALFSIHSELKILPEQLKTMARTRAGAIASKSLAQRYGWKVGDRVPMKTSIWTRKSDNSRDWFFDLVGLYDRASQSALSDNLFIINYDFFDEERAWSNGTVHLFMVQLDHPNLSDPIRKKIDDFFQNSSSQTRTRNERAYAEVQMNQVMDVSQIANAVVGAVLFTLLFVTVNTMVQGVRERIPELAVLKTLGYSDCKVLALIHIEALVLCVGAALVGLAIARLIFPTLAALFGFVSFPLVVFVGSIAVAIGLAVVSSLPAVWQLSRLDIVDALAGR